MSTNFNSYIAYLASVADSQSLAVQAETNIYPLFSDLRRLINHYYATIEKFSNVQNELVSFLDRLNFDDSDFDYYQGLFKKLKKVDGYLQELKSKQVPASISKNIQEFIEATYSLASLYDLEKIEEQVLSNLNQSAEVNRYEQYEEKKQAQNTKNIIIGIVIFLVIILIIAKCSS